MKKAFVFYVFICFLITIPAYSIKKDTKLILSELQKVKEVVNILEQKILTISNNVLLINKRANVLVEKINAITNNQADEHQTRENFIMNLQFIKEEINELKNRLSQINDKISNLSSGDLLKKREEQIEGQNQNISIQSPESTYYTSYSDYLKENYDLAIQGFRQFIKLFPDNGLVDNSLYWIGECYYSQKNYREAVNIFKELIEKYKDGDKIQAASLKRGFALIEMGKQSEGINALRELISKFPLSEEASLAQQKIKEITE